MTQIFVRPLRIESSLYFKYCLNLNSHLKTESRNHYKLQTKTMDHISELNRWNKILILFRVFSHGKLCYIIVKLLVLVLFYTDHSIFLELYLHTIIITWSNFLMVKVSSLVIRLMAKIYTSYYLTEEKNWHPLDLSDVHQTGFQDGRITSSRRLSGNKNFDIRSGVS